MHSSSNRAGRRGRSFAPRLEVLEGRDCPSCTVTFREGLLSIVGDRGANDVAVVNTWAGTQVRCDDGATMTFTGVRAVSIRTMDGDDHVSITSRSGDMPATVPPTSVDLGGGDDTFTADIAGRVMGPVVLAVYGGPGNDHLTATTSLLPEVQSSAISEVQFTMIGGAGDDVLVATTNFVPEVQSSAIPEVQFTMDGGAGNDELTAQFVGGQPSSLEATMLGGEGNDRLTAMTNFVPEVQSSAVPEVQFNLDMGGGAGADVLTYMKSGATAHHSHARLAGGAGNDIIAVTVQSNAQNLIDTSDHIDMDGGAGNDRLTFIDLPDPGFQTLLGYSYVLTMHGGAGNDVLYANAKYFNGGGYTGSILEYGDAGDDRLTLLYEGPYSTLLMDGGPGIDIGLSPTRHTPNVTVVNCEL